MGLLTLPLKLPFLPLLEVIRIAEIIRQETERQYHNPSQVRRELEDAQRQFESGGMSQDEMSRIEYTATSRMYAGMPAAGSQVPANRRRAAAKRRQAPANRRQAKTGGDRHG